jgi:hypothetical protein
MFFLPALFALDILAVCVVSVVTNVLADIATVVVLLSLNII